MVVVMDGEILLDPINLTVVINSPKMAGIDRYVIGVSAEYPKALVLICPPERS